MFRVRIRVSFLSRPIHCKHLSLIESTTFSVTSPHYLILLIIRAHEMQPDYWPRSLIGLRITKLDRISDHEVDRITDHEKNVRKIIVELNIKQTKDQNNYTKENSFSPTNWSSRKPNVGLRYRLIPSKYSLHPHFQLIHTLNFSLRLTAYDQGTTEHYKGQLPLSLRSPPRPSLCV